MSYFKRCAEESAVQAYRRQGIAPASGIKISYVVKEADRWEVDLARMASRFDAEYYGKLMRKGGRRLHLFLNRPNLKSFFFWH